MKSLIQSKPKDTYLLHINQSAMRKLFCLLITCFVLFLFSCDVKVKTANSPKEITVGEYFNYGDTGVQSGGIKMIPIRTPVGEFKVWTKRFGNNPHIKVLL